MTITYGHRYYGKVDSVRQDGRELFYVVTGFTHICSIPIFPTGSYLVQGGTESWGSFQGKPIPLSIKSVLITYLRTLTVLPLLLAVVSWIAVRACNQAGEDASEYLPGAVSYTVGSILIYVFTLIYNRPSAERIQELRALSGLGSKSEQSASLLSGAAAAAPATWAPAPPPAVETVPGSETGFSMAEPSFGQTTPPTAASAESWDPSPAVPAWTPIRPPIKLQCIEFLDQERMLVLRSQVEAFRVPQYAVRRLFGGRVQNETTVLKTEHHTPTAFERHHSLTLGGARASHVTSKTTVVDTQILACEVGGQIYYVDASGFNFRASLGDATGYSASENIRLLTNRFAWFSPQAQPDAYVRGLVEGTPLPPTVSSLKELMGEG